MFVQFPSMEESFSELTLKPKDMHVQSGFVEADPGMCWIRGDYNILTM